MIFVVEDDADIGKVISSTIQEMTSYRAVLFTDGFQALKAVRTLTPHLFILDYHLPGMNGIELYDKLQESAELQPIPVLMMSASLPQDELEKRKIIPLQKPFEINELLEKISELASSPRNGPLTSIYRWNCPWLFHQQEKQ
jgi:DNA-binding response OmpR family regulator